MEDDETKIETPAVKETPSLREEFLNIIGELEGRIEKLEADAVKLKSGMPQIQF